MEDGKKEWYVRGEDGKVYGPASVASLVEWAKDGRVDPSSYLSRDRLEWIPAQLMPELEMKWLVETEPGKIFGPFNRELVKRLTSDGSMPKGSNVYCRWDIPVDRDPDPVIVEKVVERIVEKRVEVPVERIVEKIVEVEPPARTAIVVPEVVEDVIDTPPPRRIASGIFKGADPAKLAALEEAARRELASARKHGLGTFFGGRK